MKHKIINIAAITALSLTITFDCLARGKLTPQNDQTQVKSMISSHENNKAFYFKGMKNLPGQSTGSAAGSKFSEAKHNKATVSGLSNLIKKHDSKIMATRVDTVKRRINNKKRITVTYTEENKARDIAKVEQLKASFLQAQSIK